MLEVKHPIVHDLNTFKDKVNPVELGRNNTNKKWQQWKNDFKMLK